MGRDRSTPTLFACRSVAVRRKARARALGAAGAVALGGALFADVIGAGGLVQALVPFVGVGGNALLFAAIYAAIGRRRADATLEVDDERITVIRAGRRETLPRASIRGGWVVPSSGGAVAHIECVNGDVLRAELGSADEANALLESVGVGAQQRALRVRMGPRWKAAAVGVAAAMFALVQIFPVFMAVPHAASVGVTVALATLMAWISAALFGPATVVIGTDGLEVQRGLRREFVAYAQIRSVDTLGRSVLIERLDGHWVTITASNDDRAHLDAVLERIRRAIADAPAAGASEAALSTLDRNGSAFELWLDKLRAAAGGGAAYRNVRLTADEIERVLFDARMSPERRIGAAVALRAIDAKTASERIRVAAETSASEPVRVALERVLDDRLDEESVALAAASRGTALPAAAQVDAPGVATARPDDGT